MRKQAERGKEAKLFKATSIIVVFMSEWRAALKFSDFLNRAAFLIQVQWVFMTFQLQL